MMRGPFMSPARRRAVRAIVAGIAAGLIGVSPVPKQGRLTGKLRPRYA